MRPTQPSDEYLTTQPVADLAKKVLGDIYFDPYGHSKQRVKVRTMHTKETGNQPWPKIGPWWINPAFSQSDEQVPRVAKWVTENNIDSLMLCLAAPGSMYWREAIWSKHGPQRIAWMPRLSFDQFDERQEIVEYIRRDNGRKVKVAQYRKWDQEQNPLLDQVDVLTVPNPNYETVAATEQSISRDLALMCWSTNPVVVNRFVREVTAFAKELNPKAAPIGFSLGGGAQP